MTGAGSWVPDEGQHQVYAEYDFASQINSEPPFMSIPAAGDRNATVTQIGVMAYDIDLIDPVSINGYPFDLQLVYRTNRQAAWDQVFGDGTYLSGGTATSATVDLNEDWNITAIDRPVILGTIGSGSTIHYTSGGGTVRVGHEITAPSGVSGTFWSLTDAAYVIFRYHTYNEHNVLDRHRPDGSVMRYEPLGSGVWRPTVFFDPYDNAYPYTYNSSSGRLTDIDSPTGNKTKLIWTSSSLTIERSHGGVLAADLTETITLSNGRITGYSGPSTPYVSVGTNQIHDLSQITTAPLAFGLSYNGSGLLSTITDVRNGNAVVLSNTYTSAYGMNRVATQVGPHGGTHSFVYSTNTLSQLVTAYTDPLGNQYEFVHNADGYPKSYTLTPSSTGGRPRADAGDPAEPTSLTWGFEYNGCGCGQLTRLLYPSGRDYNMTYDGNGNMLTWSTLSPTGTGTETYTWTYAGIDQGSRPLSYAPPGSSNENASIAYTYNWTSRANGIWGQKPTSITATSSQVDLVNGGHQTLVTSLTVDSKGRPISILDTGGTYSDFYYKASGAGAELLERIERRAVGSLGTKKVLFTQDDYGRVSDTKEGTDGNYADRAFTFDALGRTLTDTVNPGGGQPNAVTTIYRDAFEHVAVVLRNNVDYTGQGPKYDDGTGAPRANIRTDYVSYYDRLVDMYVDRRALPESEDLSNPATGSNPWMLRYQADYDQIGRMTSVIGTNGAVTTYVWDGYGMFYKAIGDGGAGGINADLGRYFFDNDLVLKEHRALVKVAGNTTTGTSAYTRNHGGKGYICQVTYPDGVQEVRDFERLGRTKTTSLFDATSVRRQFAEVVYDQLGRVKSAKRWFLDSSGSVSGLPAQTDFLYNTRSQVTEVTAPLARKSFRSYDDYGRLKTAHDNLSTAATDWNEVELTYMTGRDLVTAVVSKVFEESNDNSPPSGTRKDYRTEYEYDLLGRVLKTKRKGLVGSSAAVLESAYAYNSLGAVAFFQEPQQQGTTDQFTRGVFDAEGRWIQLIKTSGTGTGNKILLRSEYVDWQSGSKATEVKRYDGDGFVTRSQFDALYRLENHYRPGYTTGQPHKTSVQYDIGSMIDRVVDGNGSEINYSRDIVGRVLSRSVTPGSYVSSNATREQFGFDTIGRLASIETDAFGASNQVVVHVGFQHDSLNRLLSESFQYIGTGSAAFDVTSSFAYAGGQPVGDPAFRRNVTYPSGFQVATEPDALGRLEEVKLTPPSSAQFTLTKYRYASGNVLHRQAWLGSGGSMVDTTVGFDDHGRLGLLQHQIGTNAPFDKYSYTWNSADDLIRKKHELGATTAGELFQYDGFHRLTGAKQGVPSPDADGSYSAASYAKEVLYGLDPGQNRSSVVVNLPSGSSSSTYTTDSNSPRYTQAEGTTPLYDGEGNMMFDGTRYYLYDFRNRLSEVYGVYQSGSLAMSSGLSTSSGAGVRLTATRAGRVRVSDLAGGRQQLVNRASGNLIGWARQLRPGSADLRSSPITASGASSSSGSEDVSFELRLEALYGYDPFNRRVVNISPMVVENDFRYAYDGWREVEQLVMSGTSVIDRRVSIWGHGIGELLSYQKTSSAGWTPYYPTQDEQGSVVRLLDGSGNTVERVEYDQYGMASYFWTGTSGAQSVSAVHNPWTYATGRLDQAEGGSQPDTGLLYLRNRYLKVEFGRFCTVDPAGDWRDGLSMGNSYSYAGSNSAKYRDALGLLTGGPQDPQPRGGAQGGGGQQPGAGSGGPGQPPGGPDGTMQGFSTLIGMGGTATGAGASGTGVAAATGAVETGATTSTVLDATLGIEWGYALPEALLTGASWAAGVGALGVSVWWLIDYGSQQPPPPDDTPIPAPPVPLPKPVTPAKYDGPMPWDDDGGGGGGGGGGGPQGSKGGKKNIGDTGLQAEMLRAFALAGCKPTRENICKWIRDEMEKAKKSGQTDRWLRLKREKKDKGC